MMICEICPYPLRCEDRGKCVTGHVPGVSDPLPEPEPMNVLTTKGNAKTGVKSKKKGLK